MSANEICFLLWLVGMTLIWQLEGTVDCPTACKKCHSKVEHGEILEVYCAMCHECKNRRRSRREGYEDSYEGRRFPEDEIENAPDDEGECPTPPPCESDYDAAPIPLKTSVDTTTSTTTTTTRRPCPAIPACKKRRHPKQMCCLPMCAYPSYCPGMQAAPAYNPQPLTQTPNRPRPSPRQRSSPPAETTPTTTNSDYYYVHIGVPKELV